MEPTKSIKRHLRSITLAAVLALVLNACGTAEPFDYTETGEIPDGPGLFSGKDGKFVLYRK